MLWLLYSWKSLCVDIDDVVHSSYRLSRDIDTDFNGKTWMNKWAVTSQDEGESRDTMDLSDPGTHIQIW